MTVGDLINALEGFDADAEVRIAEVGHRSRFEYDVDDVAEVVMYSVPPENGSPNTVYLLEGTQIGYLPSAAREELGV